MIREQFDKWETSVSIPVITNFKSLILKLRFMYNMLICEILTY
jgi:hypothetical protein